MPASTIARALLATMLAAAPLPGAARTTTDQGFPDPGFPYRIERTDSEIRLKVSNIRAEPIRCRFLLRLMPVDRTREPVPVDVDLMIPGKTVDFIAWRVVGDVAAWRVPGNEVLSCKRMAP